VVLTRQAELVQNINTLQSQGQGLNAGATGAAVGDEPGQQFLLNLHPKARRALSGGQKCKYWNFHCRYLGLCLFLTIFSDANRCCHHSSHLRPSCDR
jgi:hypothetical protein